MTRHFSTSLSLVLFSAGSHLRAANKPHANGALERKGIWTNDYSGRLSDHRPVSIIGQITEEVTDAAAAPAPHITPAIRVISVFQRHLLNPEHKEMMEKVLLQ
jgi:hypothetical protein